MFRHLVTLLCMVVALAGPWLAPSGLHAHVHDRPHLLIPNSCHPELPWTKGLMRGLHSVFQDSGLPLITHVEYLDGIRHRQEDIFPVM